MIIKTNKKLINKKNGKEFDIYEDDSILFGFGILMEEAFGVTSGQTLLYLNQLKIDEFEIKEC